ncbi:MAG TPA: hypothetical protein VIY29_04630 [Ktedonobacteraceae bacterium]
MDARFYSGDKLNIERLATDLEHFFRSQGYKVQQIGSNDQLMVQLKKGSDFESIIGMQAALTITIQRTGGGVMVAVGQQKWIDKAAVGVVGFAIPALWPLLITAGVGAFRQAGLANQVMTILDGLVHQQQPDVRTGPAPTAPPPQQSQP